MAAYSGLVRLTQLTLYSGICTGWLTDTEGDISRKEGDERAKQQWLGRSIYIECSYGLKVWFFYLKLSSH